MTRLIISKFPNEINTIVKGRPLLDNVDMHTYATLDQTILCGLKVMATFMNCQWMNGRIEGTPAEVC